MESRMILARHGCTAANLARPYVMQGRSIDQSLAPLGVRQAEALATALASLPLAAVVSSPLRRARETAELVASRHGLEVTLNPDLVEASIGLWEGQGWDAIRARWPAEVAAFEADPGEVPYLGGESFHQVRDRAVPALERLLAESSGGLVAVVAHNVVNRAALAHWLGVPMTSARRLPSDNCGYAQLEWRGERVKVRSLNVAGHLSGLLPIE